MTKLKKQLKSNVFRDKIKQIIPLFDGLTLTDCEAILLVLAMEIKRNSRYKYKKGSVQ